MVEALRNRIQESMVLPQSTVRLLDDGQSRPIRSTDSGGQGRIDLFVDLDTSWLAPGAYVLVVEVHDPGGGGEKAFRAVSFIRTTRERFFDPVL